MSPGNATDNGQDPTRAPVLSCSSVPERIRRIICNARFVLALQCTLSVATIAICQRYRLDSPENTGYLSVIASVLVLFFEVVTTRMLEAAPDAWIRRRWPRAGRIAVTLGMLGRLILWECAILVLVEWPAHLVPGSPFVFLRPAFSRSFWFGEIAIVLIPGLAIVALALWALLVELLVIRRGILRGSVVMIGGPVLLVALSLAWYHVVIPPTKAGKLADADRVQVVFDPADMPLSTGDPWKYPRTVVVDDTSGNVFAAFGATFGKQATKYDAPNLWQFNRKNDIRRSLPATQTRAIALDPSGPYVWAAPWHNFNLLKINKDSFAVERSIDLRPHVKSEVFEPLAAAILPPFVYIGLTTPPALIKVDTRSGEVAGYLDATGPGGIQNVDVIVGVLADDRDNALFLTVEGPVNGYVIRVDPDQMKITGHSKGILHTPWNIAATTTGPSELFVTTEHGFTTYRIDPKTLEISPLVRSMPFASIAFDPWIDRLVITDVSAGTISLVTRDGKIGPSFPAGTKPSALAVSREGIYVLSASGILKFSHRRLGLPLCVFPSPDPDVSCTPVRESH